MPILAPVENTVRMNVASLIVDILLRGKSLQNHWIVDLAVMKSKRF